MHFFTAHFALFGMSGLLFCLIWRPQAMTIELRTPQGVTNMLPQSLQHHPSGGGGIRQVLQDSKIVTALAAIHLLVWTRAMQA
jgi:hypothetical protein